MDDERAKLLPLRDDHPLVKTSALASAIVALCIACGTLGVLGSQEPAAKAAHLGAQCTTLSGCALWYPAVAVGLTAASLFLVCSLLALTSSFHSEFNTAWSRGVFYFRAPLLLLQILTAVLALAGAALTMTSAVQTMVNNPPQSEPMTDFVNQLFVGSAFLFITTGFAIYYGHSTAHLHRPAAVHE